MRKHIRSDDPRKKLIIFELKKKSGGTKVTMVTQVGEFEGRCLKPEVVNDGQFLLKTGKYTELGTFTVQIGFHKEESVE